MSKSPIQIAVTDEQIAALREIANLADRVLAEAPADASYYSAFIDCEGVSHRLTLEQLRLLSSLPADLQSAADTPAPQTHLEGDKTAKLEADRNLYKGKYRSIIALMDDTRQKIQEIVDHIDDEGDRTYFGSSNHADWLRDLVDDMDGWSFDAMLPTGDINKMERDPYAEIREQRFRANRALAALKDAVGHIEHMAGFIAAQKLGYSFESLGEDMLGMKDALAAEGRE